MKKSFVLEILTIVLLATASIPALSLPQNCRTSAEHVSKINNYSVSIQKYYQNIDAGNIQAVLDLFSKNSSYNRGDSFALTSKEEIEIFYNKKRTLRGNHSLNSIQVLGNAVYVSGIFDGTSDGTPIHLRFSDLWIFDSYSGQVTYRKSWIDKPGV